MLSVTLIGPRVIDQTRTGTTRATDLRANRLHYDHRDTLGGSRTPNLMVRSHAFYPVELRGQILIGVIIQDRLIQSFSKLVEYPLEAHLTFRNHSSGLFGYALYFVFIIICFVYRIP